MEASVVSKRVPRPSTVGRGKAIAPESRATGQSFVCGGIHLFHGDSLEQYHAWQNPQVIVSDGAYGILGFESDTADHKGLPEWYEPHIKEWSRHATAETTLWFWNSEIGWASVHPLLEKHGWQYVNCNVWDKGKGHIAGNVNTAKIRRFPVVTEICVQYHFEAKIEGLPLKDWLIGEWQRTGLPLRMANEACGVRDAAVRKYLDKGHLWYPPPPEMFAKMAGYANCHGRPDGRPYFSRDGQRPLTPEEWRKMRAKFSCPHGFTNVWHRQPLRGNERVKAPQKMKAAHLNQKPLDLMKLIIEASTDPGDLVWEPFGGLCSASLAAKLTGRRAYGCEIDGDYFSLAVDRFKNLELF